MEQLYKQNEAGEVNENGESEHRRNEQFKMCEKIQYRTWILRRISEKEQIFKKKDSPLINVLMV